MPGPIIAVVVPCYNTSSACVEVITRAAAHAGEVLAVDDGSTDDTAEHLRASPCRVLSLPRNLGKGAALAAGFRSLLRDISDTPAAHVNYILTIDGDGQHDPADIPRLIAQALASRADLVLGVRQPDAMPRKNRIGSHFSRLLFLIGAGAFVADTQSGFRLYSVPLLAALIDRVTWQGYESESEVLWRALDNGFTVSAVAVSTIYIDGNRRSQFSPWRDSTRIAAVFKRQIAWTVGMAWLDVALFAAMVTITTISPAAANIASRAAAVLCQGTLRRDYLSRTARLVGDEGSGWCTLAFLGHLALTTLLLSALVRAGLHPVAAKAFAQLTGYLATFAMVDRVLLYRAITRPRPTHPNLAPEP